VSLLACSSLAADGASAPVREVVSERTTGPAVERTTGPAVEGTTGAAVKGQEIDQATGLPSYLVQLRASPRTTNPAAAAKLLDKVLSETIGAARVRFRYEHAVIGFAAPMSPAEAARVRTHPLVARVEPDMTSSVTMMPDGAPSDPNSPNPWGLRRISRPDELAPAFDPCGADGTGVTIVVIDSGITPSHAEFEGRITHIENFYTGPDGKGGIDIFGHGTHVASCAAGATTGAAPGANIISLAVTSPADTIADSSVVAALNWVAVPGHVQLPAVVNMSIGGPISGSVAIREEAIATVVSHGIPVVVAAGNDSWPASWRYPSASAFTLTVGATDIDDHPAVFTNFGPEVSLWAPGCGILAADWKRPPNGLKIDNGTSMASPIAAGVAALYLQRHPPTNQERAAAPVIVATRTYLALMAAAARGPLEDVADPTRVAPGGHGAMAGAANRLLQTCDRPAAPSCTDDETWIGDSRSIILGDGITPIDASFQCIRNVRNPMGTVSVTVNTVSLGVTLGQNGLPNGTLARVQIFDAGNSAVLWDSNTAIHDLPEAMKLRKVYASGPAGVNIEWQPVATSGDVGFGYAMTATLSLGRSGLGDLDGNGTVEGSDLGLMLSAWGDCPGALAPCIADLDGNRSVDAADLGMLMANWGVCKLTVPAGFVADCNDKLVLRSYLGDDFRDGPGTLTRPMRPNPLHFPDLVYPVTLDCEARDWDTDAGNRVSVSYYDPRPGACTLADGQCIQATFAQCRQEHGFFWGRGLACSEVGGLAPEEELNGCAGGVGLGLPHDSDQPWYPAETLLRQPVPVGITSISELRFLGNPGNIATANSLWDVPSYQNVSAASRPIPTESFPVRVTVWFRDGGQPLVVDRLAVTRIAPVPSGGWSPLRLFSIGGVLAPSEREVLSVAVQAMPEGLDFISTMRMIFWAGRSIPNDDPSPGAEISVDAGHSWLPAVNSVNTKFQASMCIER
jgi:subtilisin family serine protease